MGAGVAAGTSTVLDAPLAQLLLAPILIDTVNMELALRRTTATDMAAVQLLSPLAWPAAAVQGPAALKQVVGRSAQRARMKTHMPPPQTLTSEQGGVRTVNRRTGQRRLFPRAPQCQNGHGGIDRARVAAQGLVFSLLISARLRLSFIHN